MSEGAEGGRPRYSAAALPPYSYVSGFTPHPVSDPRGHMHGALHALPLKLLADNWQVSECYRFGVDLFNHGFYWEAHEAWESLWHAAGRAGPTATWLKALIKLAAAGVKAREGNAAGVARHAARSLALLAELQRELPAGVREFCGLRLASVEGVAESLLRDAAERFTRPQPELLLAEWLELSSLSTGGQ